MTLTEKEIELLRDMKSEEELCIKKYTKYSQAAKCECLSKLLDKISKAESSHLSTINDILGGKEPQNPTPLSENNEYCCACTYSNQQDKDEDAFMCQDMLAMEKHVSALYNTGVFEFSAPKLRKVLNHIQSEEQQHGEWLYAFMKANQMYN